MPELPEVERAARLLRAVIEGRTISAVRVIHPALRRALPEKSAARLRGARVERVEQRAKHQALVLDDGRLLHVHFRMAGDWDLGRTGDPEPRHARLVIELADGGRVALVDPRALATVALLPAGSLPFASLGPEPQEDAFTVAWLRAALSTRRGAIKPALLDQRVVAGLGNIYAAEALWEAGVSPLAPAQRLSAARLERLVAAVRRVIERARQRRSRYSEGVDDGLRVYGREQERCERCGARVRRIVQAGRSTYYCPRCQRR